MDRSIIFHIVAVLLVSGCSSGSVERPIAEADGGFTVSVAPAELTLQPGGSGTVTVTLERTGGFVDPVQVSASALPAGITADALVIARAQSSGDLMLRSAGTGSATRVPVAVTATSGSHTATVAFELTVLANPDLRAALTADGAVFVGERAQLTAVFDGDAASIDGIGAVQSGVAVQTPPLSRTTTFTLRVTRGDHQIKAQAIVQANYRNRIRLLRSAPVAQTGHLAAALPGGRALVMGGRTSESPLVPDSTLTQLFDPATEAFAPGPELVFSVVARVFTSVTQLVTGDFVLVGTGLNAPVGNLRAVTTQSLDSASGKFVQGEEAATGGIANRITTPLLDGALISGGIANTTNPITDSVDRFDAASGHWRAAHPMLHVRVAHTATLLADGRVLIAGGLTCCQVPNPSPDFFASTAEIYDPATDAFALTGSMNAARGNHAAVLLRDGRVLISGGSGNDPAAPPVGTEIFDPATGQFSPGGDLQAPRDSHFAIALTDGRVLLIGGEVPPGLAGRSQVAVKTTEIFDPATGRWSAGPTLDPAFFNATITLLSSGKVLVFGGEDLGGAEQAAAALFE